MLETPSFLPRGRPDCGTCAEFERLVEESRRAKKDDWDVVAAYHGEGEKDYASLSILRFHPALEPVRTYGSPEGPGTVYRCARCGSEWDYFLWVLCGYEAATVTRCGDEEKRSYGHPGPWTGLVDLEGARSRWSVTDTALRLESEVPRDRVHPAALEILERHYPGAVEPSLRIRLSADLHCSAGVKGGGQSTMRTARSLASPPEERLCAGWVDGMIARLVERGGEMEARPFLYSTMGFYLLELGDARLEVLVDHVEIAIGPLPYMAAHHLEEVEAPEEHILWLFDLARCFGLPEAPDGAASGVPRQFELLPANLLLARRAYGEEDLSRWARLVLGAPGLHVFHTGTACGGRFRRELEELAGADASRPG